MMLQQSNPKIMIATGKQYTIRDLLDSAFSCVGIQNWKRYVNIDSRLNSTVMEIVKKHLMILAGNRKQVSKNL